MRFLANENIPAGAVEALRARGHDVRWVRREMPGASDRDVPALADTEHRTLLTFDKDFGELAFRYGLTASCGVILLRWSAGGSQAMTVRITATVESRADWAGLFAVAEPDRLRLVRLPGRT